MATDPAAPTPPVADPPKTMLDKVGVVLPIALTAIATIFAGKSTHELQQAVIWRGYAAQDQAKTTNQWSYAGFKRDRALICQTTAVQLRATDKSAADPFAGTPPAGADAAAFAWLSGAKSPAAKLPPPADDRLVKLLADIRDRVPERELLEQAGRIPPDVLNQALDAAEKFVTDVDKDQSPTFDAARKLAAAAPRPAGDAAMFDLENRRYKMESALNQNVGYLYEARVKVSSAESERHQHKSVWFSYAMLAAQVGATVGALALARQRKSLVWLIAGGTGLVAIAIGAGVLVAPDKLPTLG